MPTNIDQLQSVTVSIPTDEFKSLTGDAVESLYLRPMVKALAKKINTLGNVCTAAIPLPDTKYEMAWLCDKGRIPVLIRIVRRVQPDRHQILIHALVQSVVE
jgi:hypothetical protein